MWARDRASRARPVATLYNTRRTDAADVGFFSRFYSPGFFFIFLSIYLLYDFSAVRSSVAGKFAAKISIRSASGKKSTAKRTVFPLYTVIPIVSRASITMPPFLVSGAPSARGCRRSARRRHNRG